MRNKVGIVGKDPYKWYLDDARTAVSALVENLGVDGVLELLAEECGIRKDGYGLKAGKKPAWRHMATRLKKFVADIRRRKCYQAILENYIMRPEP